MNRWCQCANKKCTNRVTGPSEMGDPIEDTLCGICFLPSKWLKTFGHWKYTGDTICRCCHSSEDFEAIIALSELETTDFILYGNL